MRTQTWTLLLLLLGASAAACGGSSAGGAETASEDEWGDDWGDDAPTVESHAGAIEALGITPPEGTTWAEMSYDERDYYMVGKVLPIMKELFADFNERQWPMEEFECSTCHGRNGREEHYRMAAADSLPIPDPGTPEWDEMVATYGEAVTFMQETVTPTMGTLLGVEDYSCWHCHVAPGGVRRFDTMTGEGASEH